MEELTHALAGPGRRSEKSRQPKQVPPVEVQQAQPEQPQPWEEVPQPVRRVERTYDSCGVMLLESFPQPSAAGDALAHNPRSVALHPPAWLTHLRNAEGFSPRLTTRTSMNHLQSIEYWREREGCQNDFHYRVPSAQGQTQLP